VRRPRKVGRRYFSTNPVVRVPGEVVQPSHRALRVMPAFSLAILVRKSPDAVEAPLSANRFDELHERVLALAADGKVHVLGI
jgi:hypothetical protein